MVYPSVVCAHFVERVNRFVARVELDGTVSTVHTETVHTEMVHVKNTGRLRELLVPGRRTALAVLDNPARKTRFDLVAVEVPGVGFVNIDSQAVNDAAEEWLRAKFPAAEIRREVTKGASRFDFCITEGDAICYLEAKGVTLVEDGAALFPDAPTERGVKHLRELAACAREGIGARVLFVVQRGDAVCVKPNVRTHAAFGEAMREAADAGVIFMAAVCDVTERTLEIVREIEVCI